MAVLKITKSNAEKILKECKKNQIVKFPTAMAEDDVRELAASFKFRVEFFEPSTREYKTYGRNICKLY